MLSDFFRINLPYCFERVEGDKWRCLNREYQPIGVNKRDVSHSEFPDLLINTSYKGGTEKFLTQIIDDPARIQRDSDGKISKIFLYDDGTNPMNQARDSKKLWDSYFEKLKKLSKLKRI
ncbi:MAG TPA: hypothetical protein PKA00_19725 [Saprospiraceae bacterium]|nr:hypothetical protein [Saprospiraceae bacterium]HMQ85149.1 hypothetical protein [Saprospiraceae bacterium]